MSRLLDDDQDLMPRRDRELTLSTGAILAIFLGLVLLCGVFFGFGYNLGRKSTTIAANSAASAEPSDTTNFDSFRPASAPPETKPASKASGNPEPPPSVEPVEPAPPKPAPATPRPQPSSAAASRSSTEAPSQHPAAVSASSAPAITPNGSFVVQVAAISRKDDADMLVTALRGKGYEVAAHSIPQDKLLHIQVGPFATRTEAEEMRKRLLADGYNAILK